MSGQALACEPRLEFGRDVRAGLSRADQKELPSKYLYDDVGSALFEAITCLPEYGLTRAGQRLLRKLAPQLRDHITGPVTVAELGSGTGKKTRHILEALKDHQELVYYPIDVSSAALDKCRLELASVARVVRLQETYISGLQEAALRRPADHKMLVLFLGSTIGNLDRHESEGFLREIRSCLEPGDALLLAADLVKPINMMLLAYDDPAGVTAAFNLNILARINRELGADFNLGNFVHEARYNAQARRIEMHLRSCMDQEVSIPDADFNCSLREGETIWTEASHKYRIEEFSTMASRTGFQQAAQWVDEDWPFAENLWIAISPS